MRDLVINLLASAVAAAASWTGHQMVRYRRILRKRSFFGVNPGAKVMLFVAKHFSSPRPQSVHRNDVATLVELATFTAIAGAPESDHEHRGEPEPAVAPAAAVDPSHHD